MADKTKETKEMNNTEHQTETGENTAADETQKTSEDRDTATGVNTKADADGQAEADVQAVEEETVEPEADETDESEAEETEQAKAGGKKEGIFKKKKKTKEQEQIEELTDRVKRQMAEFDNFRKRTEKEKAQMFETGAKSIIEKILPVVDNFERGLAALSEEEKAAPFAEGMDKIYKQMMTMLTEAGVTPIEAEGKEFDPNLHNAVMHIDDESLGENIVVQELQKGYMYRDSVVRHSMVQVAN